MASSTTNLELVKQANNENWSNDIHNANLEKIDAKFGAFNGTVKENLDALASDWGTKTTDWLASAEQGSGAFAVFSRVGKMVTIGITTVSRAHSENDVISTIETGFRPNVAINVIGTIGNTPCVIRFAVDGTVSIWLLSAQTSGRVYATATFATP